jgi:hypothetical protein
MASSPAEAKAKVDQARKNVQECEMEMQMLKSKIRDLGTDGGDPNSLELAVLKVSNTPNRMLIGRMQQAWYVFLHSRSRGFQKEQLSSPIEEAAITKIFDPLDPTAEGSFAKFNGVETSNAILAISAKDADVPLGASASIDIASLCSISDPTQSVYLTEKSVAIYAEGGGDVELTVAVCTVTFNVTYKPSAKDQREELYELLNKASEKKSKYVAEMQQAAKLAHRAAPASTAAVMDAVLWEEPRSAVIASNYLSRCQELSDLLWRCRSLSLQGTGAGVAAASIDIHIRSEIIRICMVKYYVCS